MNSLTEIATLLKTLESAVIFTHTRPDGDAIGGALALSRALNSLGVENEVVCESDIPARLAFLPDVGNIRRAPTIKAEAYIAVDASDEMRFGQLREVFIKGGRKRVTVNIDHHVSNTRFAKYNFVRERASNCENILQLIEEMGAPLSKEIADCLMTGMTTDSGGFSHSDVNGDTFRAAGKMADAGADVNTIVYETMKRQTKARATFYAKTISRLRYLLDNRLCVALIRWKELNDYGLKADATEGIVDFALTVDGVEVSVCLLEMKEGQYKASFRSKGRVNVNTVAGTFGGGGHVLASGCMVFGTEEEVIDKIRYAVYQNTEL